MYANGANRTTDMTPSDVRFRQYRGELQLWFTSEDNGFQIVTFSDHLKETEKDLLSDDENGDDDE